jgi:hypothetical protein
VPLSTPLGPRLAANAAVVSGPLQELRPGPTVEHVEDWYLFREADATDEAAVERTVLPRVQATPVP